MNHFVKSNVILKINTGDRHNRAGRIALIEDASGGEAYYYGSMGEVVKTVRTVVASAADVRTYVHGATYDSWNRVRTMTYPDGEIVTYHYNEAGQVESLTSNKLGKETTIVEQMGYDELGHTVYTNFAQDWKNMKSDNIKEVNLNYHGSNQALHLDYQNNQYITATGNGYTNTQPQRNRVPAFNVQDLPMPIGNISHAQLNINSCKSNSTTQKPLLGNGKTLMKTFSEIFNFQAVRGTSVGVSYGRFDLKPHPKYFTSDGWFKSWEYIGNPISIPAPQKSNINDFLYYKTGGRK